MAKKEQSPPAEPVNAEVPVAIDFVSATNVFSLGGLQKVTAAMVDIVEDPDGRGYRMYSKNRLEVGYQLVTWAGAKNVRYMLQKDYDERQAAQAG